MLGACYGIEAGNVPLEYFLRPRYVPDVFLIVDLFCVEKIILLEPSDLEGRVEKVGDSLSEHDLLLNEMELNEGKDGKADDDRYDGVAQMRCRL